MGGDDFDVITLNKKTLSELNNFSKIEIVPHIHIYLRGIFKMYQNRIDAGQKLAEVLADYADKKDAIVLALPRGGVPVAHEVAKALSLPMDIWLVRKLGVPGQEELAMGAISVGDVIYINQEIVAMARVSQELINQTIAKKSMELKRRNKLYRQDQPSPLVKGKTVIIIDDGLATGATMHAAINSLRQAGATYIVAAVPVGSGSGCKKMVGIADKMICPYIPKAFYCAGQFYRNFSQTSDEEVQEILKLYL